MSDELPDAAVRAGADALRKLWDNPDDEYDGAWAFDARAVLVAATERIECPACAVWEVVSDGCPVCAGSGFLYVLKQETP